jgi:hypothetical protein
MKRTLVWNEVYASVAENPISNRRREVSASRGGGGGEETGEEEGLFKSKAMNEVDAGLDRAMPASVGHEEEGLFEEEVNIVNKQSHRVSFRLSRG